MFLLQTQVRGEIHFNYSQLMCFIFKYYICGGFYLPIEFY